MSKTILHDQNQKNNILSIWMINCIQQSLRSLRSSRLNPSRPYLVDSWRFSEPCCVQKLLIGPHMVAYLLKLLSLFHPPQYSLHLCFTCQIFHTNFLHFFFFFCDNHHYHTYNNKNQIIRLKMHICKDIATWTRSHV